MSETCRATKANGQPCAALPLPEGDFCLFHDPAHQSALTESRSKGGSTPRRRFRRFPLLLDHEHVGELLSELLIDALNDPTAFDAPRLRALTGLAHALLKAVGVPKKTHLIYSDRSDPLADEDHLLRLYPPNPSDPSDPPDPSDLDRLLASETPEPADPEHRHRRTPERLNSRTSNPPHPTPAPRPPEPPNPKEEPDYDAWEAEFERRYRTPPVAAAAVPSPAPLAAAPEPDWAQQPREQAEEQDANRAATGPPATNPALTADPASPPTEPSPSASVPPPGPGPRRSAPPPLRVESPSGTTLAVPGIPILISLRPVPAPFG